MATAFSLYDILGVERDASEAQIRSAFRKLTFKHHPDRYAVDDRPKAEERFQEITEAFNVLSHPESRKKYDEELAQGQLGGSGAMDSKEIARRLAAKGSQTMREGRLTDALNELKSALDHDEECSRAHFFMGVTLAKVGGGREKDALRHLERATNLEPGNAVMLSEAANVALKVGMKARAQRLAEEALSFDPTNKKATSVLQEAQIAESTQSGEGLLGRLRRKG